ncbi:MAG TPA: DUF1515 family protein [Steroidobacteraceae bacterium]|nr:DUF1515 family protein [Steroidobacteraceae bacterium]
MEDRVQRLEVEVVELRVQNAEFSGSLTALKEAVSELKCVVQDLRDTMNKGRGAVWLFGIGAAALGGLVSAILKKLLG